MPYSMTISNLITKASRVVGQHYQRECAPLGITPSQAGIVWILSMEGAKSQVEIAALLHLEKTNINAMIKKLVAAGWVAIKKVPDDGRKTEVRLTPKGKTLSKKLHKVDMRVGKHFTDMISTDAEAAVIRQFLEKIVYPPSR